MLAKCFVFALEISLKKNKAMSFRCQDCKEDTVIVVDSHNGDEICTNCGKVLQEKLICEEQEWRMFSNNDNNSQVEKSRVGAANDSWMMDTIGGTTMLGGDKKFKYLSVTHNVTTKSNAADRQLKAAFNILSSTVEHLSLRSNVTERCREIIKDLQTQTDFNFRNTTTMILGVLYFAAREEKQPIPVELLSGFDATISTQDILRAAQKVRKAYSMLNPTIDRSAYASIFLVSKVCHILKLDEQVEKLCIDMCKAIEKSALVDVSKSHYIAAVTIMFAVQLLNVSVSILDVLQAAKSGITPVIVTYAILHEKLDSILPPNFFPLNPGGINGLIPAHNLRKIKKL